ncbi:hypothetical protein BBP40_004900 [Aspergillus hancockii]|nr:hypothetical protein BBP40_004900 [Aspergillus hancockii]
MHTGADGGMAEHVETATKNKSDSFGLAIAAIPFGEGGPLMSTIYDESVALSLAELASRYPTSAGPYYWSFQVSKFKPGNLFYQRLGLARWNLGNHAVGQFRFRIVGLRLDLDVSSKLELHQLAASTYILLYLLALSVKADVARHSAQYALGYSDASLSGWHGFSFFIGLLPAAYTFFAIGMISSMAEEWLFFILPMCFILPPLQDILDAPGQALPYIFQTVMGIPGGGLGLTMLALIITLLCSISITVAASRATWAIACDEAIPLAKVWSRVNPRLGVPLGSLVLVTIVQILLGLTNLRSSSATTAFVSVGVIVLAVAYSIPIALSLLHGRCEVSKAQWNCGPFYAYGVAYNERLYELRSAGVCGIYSYFGSLVYRVRAKMYGYHPHATGFTHPRD